jgi:hypothetical protein
MIASILNKKIVLIMMGILLISCVSAWTNTTFNNSLSSETLSFSYPYEEYTDTPDDTAQIRQQIYKAQTFTVSGNDSMYLRNVSLHLSKTGSPTGTAVIGIRNANSTDVIGSDLVNTTFDSSIVSSTGWYNFSLPLLRLEIGEIYAITIGCSNCDPSNRLNWEFEGSALGYGGGQAFESGDYGATFYDASEDYPFKVYKTYLRWLEVPDELVVIEGYLNLSGLQKSYYQPYQFNTFYYLVNKSYRQAQRLSINNLTLDKFSVVVLCETGEECNGNISYAIRNATNDSIIAECNLGLANDTRGTSFKECDFTDILLNGDFYFSIERDDDEGGTYSVRLYTEPDDDEIQIEGNRAWYNGTDWFEYSTDVLIINVTFVESPLFPENAFLYVNDLTAWSYSGEFSQTNNRTSNTALFINSYLDSCTYVSNYCYVPFAFQSSKIGVLQYSDMSFTSEGFLENENIFSNTTLEGNVETFILNITANSLLSARLVYNGTSYSGTIDSSNAPNYIITRNLVIPQVNEDTNVTFYWDLTLTEGDYNSTFNNQTILNLSLDDCSSNTVTLFNFTLVDEEIKDLLNMSNPSLNGSIELDLDLSSFGYTTPFLEYSQTYTNGSFATICANINFTEATRYRTDLVGGFVTENHVQEFYYIDNGTINSTNIPQEITLYDLLLTDSTTFVFTFTDENNLIVEDAIVHVFRYYIGDGTFREVERAKEDDNGETLVHLVEEDVVYYFQVTLDGELLYTSSQYTAKCLETPCQITLTAGAVTDDFVPPDLLPEGTYSLSTDRETRLVTLAFNLNESATMNLSVFTLSGNQSRDDDVVNSSSLTAESGSFSVYVPETFGNITYYAVICHNGDIVTSQFIDLTPSARETFGVLGVFLSILLIILLGLIGATQGVWSVIFLVIGFILASMLTLLELDYLTLIFYVCLCLAIIYKLYTRKSAS